MTVALVKVNWSGFGGAPGLTQLAIAKDGGAALVPADAQSAVDATHALFSSLASSLPSIVRLNILGEVDTFDETTGTLTGLFQPSPGTQISGVNTGVWAGASGIRIDWKTLGIVDGRRRTARTFLVPAAGACFDTDGTPLSTTVTSVNSACSTYLTALSTAGLALQCWTRPSPAHLNAKGVSVPARPGFISGVALGGIVDKAAVMRSRRD